MLAVALATSLATPAPSASAAAAGKRCPAPHAAGFRITHLRAHDLSCRRAQRLVRTAVYLGKPDRYHCEHRMNGYPNLTIRCTRDGREQRWLSAHYRRA